MKLTNKKLRAIINEEIIALSESLITEATRATVAIEDKKGKIHGTYIHSDGYVDGVGAILKKNFIKADKVSKLLNLGKSGISILAGSIVGGEGHTFADPKKGESVFYGRDRGEDTDMTSDFQDRESFIGAHTEEFAYLYSTKDKKWYYTESGSKEWKEL